VRNGEDEKREFPLSNILKGLGNVVSSPSGFQGGAPAQNGF